MKRVFFDWSRPFLPQVAERVVESAADGSLELGDVVFVLPGRRAARTLESYLQIAVEREIAAGKLPNDWTPTTYLTVGAIPEFLYQRSKRPAERTTRLVCWNRALREFARLDPTRSRTLVASPPPDSDLTARLELAQIFVDLSDELASERRTFATVAAATRRRGLLEETARWDSIAAVDALYRRELAALQELDLNRAREAALARGAVGVATTPDEARRRYFVVGAADLNRLQKAFFEALGDRVEFFVFAPEAESARFDEFGCVVSDAWADFALPIADAQIFQVDKPSDQGKAVALLVRELSKKYDANDAWRYAPIPADSLTVGVPDESVVPFVEQEMQAIGYETIRAQGTPTTQNRVFQLLRNVADYLETRSFAALEELARRPDVEDYLTRNWNSVSLDVDKTPDVDANAETLVDVGADSLLDAEEDVALLPEETLERANAALEEAADDPLFDDDPEKPTESAPENAEKLDENVEKTPFIPGDWLSEFDRYRATFLPTRVDGRWFEYKNDDAPRQNAEFRLLRKVATLVDKALEPFCDAERPPISREEFAPRSVAESTADLDALRLHPSDFAATQDVFTGEFEFAKDDFSERFRWTTNQRRAPLRDWAPILSNFLCRIYPDAENAGRKSEADAQIDAFFVAINREFDKIEAIPRELVDDATGAAAIRTLLKELAKSTIPPRPASNVVELQGWLDLPFDDAPNLILTGFNEGVVPTSKTSDLFLPNDARRELGLDDAKRRFARDVYLTAALVASKRNFFVVFGRRSLQNDPLTPSRFAFATDSERVPDRICRFFAGAGSDDLKTLVARQENRDFPRLKSDDAERSPEKNDEISVENIVDNPPIRTTSARLVETVATPRPTGFRVPILRLPGTAPNMMRVTEFREFLACPYRYFLRQALKLRAASPETAVEMNAAAFGTIAHDALRDFGLSPEIRNSTDADAIAAWLGERLDAISRRYFNESTSPFVRVQLEQIRWRLAGFARWQARWRAGGREIKFVEAAPASGSISFDVGGGRPVEIFGRLDRIDYDPRENRWFVFDYKTFDSAKEGRKPAANADADVNFCADVFDDETQTLLFSTRVANVADEKHRRRAKPRSTAPLRTLAKYGIAPASNDSNDSNDSDKSDDERRDETFDWIDLQLPLYRRFFRQILFEKYEGARAWEDVETTKVSLAYVVLTKAAKTQAFGGPWTERDLRAADATASRVVRTIRRLWRAPIDPNAWIDPDDPSRGTILASKKPPFSEDLSPITLDFLRD